MPVYPAKAGSKRTTAVDMEALKKIADAHTTFPDNFAVHPKVMPQLQRRAAAITQGPIDWATGEILALGSLLLEGRTVRLTGQDTRRGLSSRDSRPWSTGSPESRGCRWLTSRRRSGRFPHLRFTAQ